MEPEVAPDAELRDWLEFAAWPFDQWFNEDEVVYREEDLPDTSTAEA